MVRFFIMQTQSGKGLSDFKVQLTETSVVQGKKYSITSGIIPMAAASGIAIFV